MMTLYLSAVMGRPAYFDVDRGTLYARCVLPPIENRDPGDETREDD
jgi:hypothetical protein